MYSGTPIRFDAAPILAGAMLLCPLLQAEGCDVIAHRGAMSLAPENTLASQRLAYELGAEYVEVDVRLSKEGIPVILHDWDVGRTTDGEGGVAGMTLQQIKQLDAGSWFSAAYAGEKVPTLAEVLETAREYNGRVVLDIKGERIGAALAPVIRSSGLEPHQVMIATWSDTMTTEYAALLPGYRLMRQVTDPVTGIIMVSQQIPDAALLRLRSMGVTDLFLARGPVTLADTRRFHAAGLRASVIYFEPATAAYSSDEGVDLFWTDYTELSKQRLRGFSCEWENWAAEHRLAPDARTASIDIDGDRLGNLEEYARGTDPCRLDVLPLPGFGVTQNSGGTRTLVWQMSLRENWSQYVNIFAQVSSGSVWNQFSPGVLTVTGPNSAEFRLPAGATRQTFRLQFSFK